MSNNNMYDDNDWSTEELLAEADATTNPNPGYGDDQVWDTDENNNPIYVGDVDFDENDNPIHVGGES